MDDARAVLVENRHGHGEAEVLEVLTDAEEVSGEVVVKEEVIDSRLDRCGGFGGAVLQPRTVAALCVETLAGRQSFVSLDEREQVERHLIVAAPRNIAMAIVYDSRHNIHVLLEYRRGIDGERCPSLEARKRLGGVKVEVGKRKVLNLWLFSTKLWTV